MRIAFDISPLVRTYPLGVVRATRGLFDALGESSSIEVVGLAPESGANERHWRHRRLPQLLKERAFDGLHSPISAFPHTGPGRRLQTVHELPWRHAARENSGLSHRFWARFGPWRADAVICPTEFVRTDLLAESPHGHSRVHACHWGIDPGFARAAVDRRALIEKYRLPDAPFAVLLGATRPKKNLAAALRALAIAEDSDLHLVVTGKVTPDLLRDVDLAASLGLRARLHTLGEIVCEDLPCLIAMARVTLVLSTSEGFGFPTLESLACATPVIVAADSAQAEVAGDAGIVTRPGDPASLWSAINIALRQTEAERSALPLRAAQFSWRECAQRVEEIWMSWAR